MFVGVSVWMRRSDNILINTWRGHKSAALTNEQTNNRLQAQTADNRQCLPDNMLTGKNTVNVKTYISHRKHIQYVSR